VAGGSLEALAAGLQRMGYTVRLARSAGGSLHQLRHSFLLVSLGGAHPMAVDPAFRDQFGLAAPDTTPRLAAALAVVPPLAVASPMRLAHAAVLLAEEVGKDFAARGMPLPPWRQAAALLSKWQVAEQAEVVAISRAHSAPLPASTALSPDSPTLAASEPCAWAAQQHTKGMARAQERLARLGPTEYQAAGCSQQAAQPWQPSPSSVLLLPVWPVRARACAADLSGLPCTHIRMRPAERTWLTISAPLLAAADADRCG
jgi:hypothetical protein